MSTIQENLDRIQNAKSAIKDAIIQKGVEVTDTEKIETYADKILQIKSGGGAEIPEFDPNGPLTIYCFDDWGDAYVQFSNNFKNGKVSYSKDKETWTQYKGEILKLAKGEFVQFKGNIIVNDEQCHFTIKNGLFNLYGNLTSLYSYNDVASYSTYYREMFKNTNLYDCSNLNFGIKYLQDGGRTFESMFENCYSMMLGPKILPATTLARACYSNMFLGCGLLLKAPELPATTLADECYARMFGGCASLTTIPNNLLPATTLTYGCYSNMFSGCTELTTIPELPATTLASSCYSNMFSGCTGLTTIPEGWYLPAQTLAGDSYNSMFSGCYNLQKMAVAYSGVDFGNSWGEPWYLFMDGVSSTGTFYYSKNQTEENIRSIVPSGWTLVQSTEW